jgi:SAM-dependent methyltransferase
VFLTVASPGDELSYLLFKHPGRVQAFDLAVGRAWVFYPRADAEATEAALLVDVDSAALARSKRFRVSGFELAHHVNDRAYAASSLLAVALGRVFRSAMAGSDPADRPGAADRPRQLTIHLPSVRSRGGAPLVRQLFEPLGWAADAVEAVPTCVDLRLSGVARLSTALSQLYVLLPTLDDSKHYWVAEAEIDKVVRHGRDWLAEHPLRDRILFSYLARQRGYAADAAARLDGAAGLDGAAPTDGAGRPDGIARADGAGRLDGIGGGATGASLDLAPAQVPLAEQRIRYLVAKLRGLGAKRVLDLGCGEGRLVRRLLDEAQFEVVGADVSPGALDQAGRRLEKLADRQLRRVSLIQASATYRDERFRGFDAIIASEVVEHIDPDRLAAVERNLFQDARPGRVIVTTPNADYNRLYGLARGRPRHPDHRFEWTRAEFQGWAERVGRLGGYRVEFDGIGPEDPDLGQPTQVALFERIDVPGPGGQAPADASREGGHG